VCKFPGVRIERMLISVVLQKQFIFNRMGIDMSIAFNTLYWSKFSSF
jgi:hypothetical protein